MGAISFDWDEKHITIEAIWSIDRRMQKGVWKAIKELVDAMQ